MDADDVRFKIAAARRMLYREGVDSQTAGHVSVRSPGEDAFWATPFEYFDETMPDHVIKVSFELELLEGNWFASPALAFHAMTYRSRADVNSVVHHHGRFTSVIAGAGRPVGQYNLLATLFWQDQAMSFDTSNESSVNDEALVDALGDRNVVLIHNHGCLVVGPTLEVATVKAILLEKAAQYDYDAQIVGGKESDIPERLESLKFNLEKYMLPEMWAAQFRRLRKSDPELFALLES
jgi:L-fuculose-phosphate aldolase